MVLKWSGGLMLCMACGLLPESKAEEALRNYGATSIDSNVMATGPQAALVAEQSSIVAGDSAAAMVAFGHRRRHCCGNAAAFPAYYGAYGTYQPNVYNYGNYGGYATYYGGYRGNPYWPPTPNPYGYYQNGWIWGSSRPTYTGPFPVWNSPWGVYDYRYRGWGSYGWGGWGGTGPAGWGYQGGFYW